MTSVGVVCLVLEWRGVVCLIVEGDGVSSGGVEVCV